MEDSMVPRTRRKCVIMREQAKKKKEWWEEEGIGSDLEEEEDIGIDVISVKEIVLQNMYPGARRFYNS